jgi:cyclic pyranopterin phosphate synthase
MKGLEDQFGRRFPYVRLSVTDACNFRCQYCLPNGYQKTCDTEFLAIEEITRLAIALAGLGVEKIRLTGGEPTVRRDLATIADALSHIQGIRTIGLTTNGYNLKSKAKAFFDAGIRALNVSVDSLNQERFHTITGHDKLQTVMRGIDAARDAGFANIKINTVLLKGANDVELPEFLDWVRREQLSVRFIELMQTGDNTAYFRDHHLSAELIRQQLIALGFVEQPRTHDAGPAVMLQHPDYAGNIGLIAPYSKDFCKSCNRLRVTSRGELMLCLFGERGYDLRPLLQADDQLGALQEKLLELLHFKRESHYLGAGITGITPHLASLGG